MKKTKYCYECDMEFSVSFKGSDQIQYCPFCGSELDDDEEVFEEESEN